MYCVFLRHALVRFGWSRKSFTHSAFPHIPWHLGEPGILRLTQEAVVPLANALPDNSGWVLIPSPLPGRDRMVALASGEGRDKKSGRIWISPGSRWFGRRFSAACFFLPVAWPLLLCSPGPTVDPAEGSPQLQTCPCQIWL